MKRSRDNLSISSTHMPNQNMKPIKIAGKYIKPKIAGK